MTKCHSMNETEFQVVNEVKNRAHAILGPECNFKIWVKIKIFLDYKEIKNFMIYNIYKIISSFLIFLLVLMEQEKY